MDLDTADLSQPVAIYGATTAENSGSKTTRIDLLPTPAVKPICPRSSANEIVVCAPDQDKFRLRPLSHTYENSPTDAVIGLGENATAGVAAEAANVGGWTSNRIMVRLKLKL